MQEEVGKGKKKNLLGFKLSKEERGKLCNIYLPLQRNNSGNDPCNWFNPRGQIKLIPFLRLSRHFFT